MATSTTNYSFTLPEVGGDTDQWGTQLNANWTLADSTIKTIQDSVVDVTLTGNDYLTISGQSITVGDVDLSADVTGTLPVASGGTGLASLGSANQVLAVNSTADGLEFQTISGSGTVTSVAVTGSDGIEIDSGSPVTTSGTIALGINATSLSTHLGLGSLATQSTITESQISDLQSYLTAESNDLSAAVTWANVPDGNITESSVTQHEAALTITESQISDLGSYQPSDAGLTSIAGLTTAADKMIYTTAADTYAVTTLTSAGRALLDDADAVAQRTTLGLGTAATSATGDFEASGAVSTHAAVTSSVHGISAFGATLVDDADAPAARTTLGLGSLATQSTITESQISDLQSYLTAELNDLSAAVTWVNVPDANVTQSSVTQHQAALSITESQISDLGTYLTDVEHSNSISTAQTISGGQHRFYVGPMTFSNTLTVAGKLLVFDGLYNQTSGTVNVTGTLHVRG